jgi:hypothetical protein
MARVEVPVGIRIVPRQVGALRRAVVRVENVEEVAIAVVEHAAPNLAEADGLPTSDQSAHSHRFGSRCELGPSPTC